MVLSIQYAGCSESLERTLLGRASLHSGRSSDRHHLVLRTIQSACDRIDLMDLNNVEGALFNLLDEIAAERSGAPASRQN